MPVARSVFETSDPTILIEVHSETVWTLISDHYFELHEIPRPSALAFLIPFYVAQVRNGGHGQYLGNGRRYRGLLDLVEEGLHRLGVGDFSLLHRRFRDFLDADHERADRFADGCGFGEIPDEVGEIDREFCKLDSGVLIDRLAGFLRHEAGLEVVDDGETSALLRAIGERNLLAAQRAAYRDAATAGALMQKRRAHPYFALAELLCDSCGRELSHVVVDWDGGSGQILSLMTTTGPVWMYAGKDLALLGLDLADVLGRPNKLPGLVAIARWQGAAWELTPLNPTYRRLTRVTPMLRRWAKRIREWRR